MPDEKKKKSWWDNPRNSLMLVMIAGSLGIGPLAGMHRSNKPKPAPQRLRTTLQQPMKIWQSEPSASPQKTERNPRNIGFDQNRPL